MQVKENIVSRGHGSLNPSYLVIHETANPGASAWNHVQLWSRDDTYAVHYVMGPDGIAYHCVPDNCLCWHVGGGNPYTVGIELYHATNQADFNKVYNQAIEFAAWYLKKRGWGIDRLLSHYDCTNRWGGSDHTDPIGYFREYGKSWDQFKSAVKAKMKESGVNKQHPGKAVNNIGIYYRSHVANLGWLDSVRDGQVSGTCGNGYALEAFKIAPPKGVSLKVKAHIANVGWKTYTGIDGTENSGTGSSKHDPIIGTTGKRQAIEAFGIEFEKNPKKYKGYFKAHIAGFGWTGWQPFGYFVGTVSMARAIEAIQIKLEA